MILKSSVSYSPWNNSSEQQEAYSGTKSESKRSDLWLALDFPGLALEILKLEDNAAPRVVTEEKNNRQLVYSVCPLARQAGITEGMPVQLARTYTSELQVYMLDSSALQRQLNLLATFALKLSSHVSVKPPCSLLIEIAGSIRYFGSLKIVIEQLENIFQKVWNHQYHFAITPTPEASLLLARAGEQKIVHNIAELRSSLGHLSTRMLPIDEKSLRQLEKIGVNVFRDLWRLPAAALSRRFSTELVDYLDRVIGKSPSLLPLHQAPVSFQASYDIAHEAEEYDLLLPYADMLLNELCDFLRSVDMYTNQCFFYFQHRGIMPTTIDISLRQALRNAGHFMMLLETRLQNRKLPAPVIALKLIARTLHPYTSKSYELFPETGKQAGDINTLFEQLQARLGENGFKHVYLCADHRPERANRNFQAQAEDVSAIPKIRPFWLLPSPRLLFKKDSHLYYKSPLQFRLGPERIESGWWDNFDIRRDYYVVLDKKAGSLWIYHDLKNRKSWYLHGLFG